MPPKSTDLLNLNTLHYTKILIFVIAFFCFTPKSQGQANSIRSNVTFNWEDTQSVLSDPANLQSITIDGVDYTTFVVPSLYEMTRLGPAGDGANNIWMNGSNLVAGSDDPNWTTSALQAYQSLNLNHYFESNGTGANFCQDYSAVATTNAQIQTISYDPGIPSNPDGVIAITERGGNNCMYVELYGIPAGGGPEQLLGQTFIRNEGNLTGVVPQAPPTANSDYWSSGRNNENNQIIGIALYELSELAPVGSIITAIRYMGATTDHGDGKFFLMQTYAEDDNIEIKLDREGNGDIAENDLVPSGSTYTLLSGTSNGTLSFNSDGTFNYVPNPGYTGTDTFQYEVCLPAPNTGVCDTGTAIIIIKLEAIFDSLNVAENSTNNVITVLDNDNFGSSGPRPNGAITNFTLPTNGSIVLNDNGTPADSLDDFFTYTPNSGYIGTDFFNYEITDAGGGTDFASVYITTSFDTDVDSVDNRTDLDDDNDGILDTVEGRECIDDDYFAWEFNSPVGTPSNDFVQNPAISNWLISGTTDVTTGAGLTASSPGSELQITDLDAATYNEAITQNEYVEVSFTTAAGLISPIIERIGMNWYENSGGSIIGNGYDVALTISNDNFASYMLLYSDIRIHYPTNGISEFFDLLPVGATFNLEENTTYTLRLYTYNQQNDGNVAHSVFDDFTIRVSACEGQNSDADLILDHQDLDSDGDGIPDNVEAQTTQGYTLPNLDSAAIYASNNGINSAYGTGLVPTNSDADALPDYLDLNSDDEGADDTLEAAITLANNDADGDGLDDATDSTTGYDNPGGTIESPISGAIQLPDADGDASTFGDVDFRDAINDNVDTDNDGIPDVNDFDDDDDGILDIVECGDPPTYGNQSFELGIDSTNATATFGSEPTAAYLFNETDVPNWETTATDDQIEIWQSGHNGIPSYAGSYHAELNATQESALFQEYTSTPGEFTSITFAHRGRSGVDVMEVFQGPPGGPFISLGQFSTGQEWQVYSTWFIVPSGQTTSQIRFEAISSATGNRRVGNLLDDIYIYEGCSDADNDGVPNGIDLDSDNDGILDAVEAGHGQPQTNGRLDGLSGANGIPDAVETTPDSDALNYVVAESSDDSDANRDYVDLDSDGDGIPDNIEAQTTTGYLAPSGTVDANGIDTAYPLGIDPTNTDGADTPDYLDLDSDNEGGNDTAEASITLTNSDTDNDGLDDATDATADYSDVGGTIDNPLNAPVILPDVDSDATTGGDLDYRDTIDDRPDNDNDGLPDVLDFDDDNDGILDTDEGCGNLIINGSFEQDDFTDTAVYSNAGANGAYIGADLNTDQIAGWTYTQNMDGWVEGGIVATAYHGRQYMDLIGAATRSGGIMNVLSQTINTIPGNTYTLSLYWGEDRGHAAGSNVNLQIDVFDASNAVLIDDNLDSLANGPIGGVQGPNSWFYYERTFIATTAQTIVSFTSNAPSPNFFSGANIDLVSVVTSSPSSCVDTDNDGVINAFDLDSDNDGIFDAVEAGHNASNTNGIVNGATGSDGIPDAVQNDPDRETVNYSVAESSDDTDTIPDYIDLDSDGDGIPDNVEAQTTMGYITPSGTVDTNGVDTAYIGGLNPINTDGSDNPDYLDLDSDNEGGNDTAEAAITLSNSDVDNDGLDDATDATADYSDVGGTIDNPLNAPVTLPDLDSDATTGGDVDFRDATDETPVDLDADDDGILDSVEDLNEDGDNDPATNPTNSDGDIYPDYLDIDSDNDGIPDNVEAQTTSGYIAPSLVDADNNGVDDAYEGIDIGLFPIDTDADGLSDHLDSDSDDDGVPDAVEGHDHDQDGIADVVFIGSDKDDDGLDDSFEGIEQIDDDVNDEIDDPINDLPNTDGDSESDYRDMDDDNDGIPTMDEDTDGDMNYANDDWDNDGVPDYLDPDPEVEIDDVEIFNVVTPNDDGVHDFLMITGLENRPDNNLRIYNRWGILVFSTESYNTQGNFFDGTSQGRTTIGDSNRLPVGTYFYIFDYVDVNGETVNLSGHLYLN